MIVGQLIDEGDGEEVTAGGKTEEEFIKNINKQIRLNGNFAGYVKISILHEEGTEKTFNCSQVKTVGISYSFAVISVGVTVSSVKSLPVSYIQLD